MAHPQSDSQSRWAVCMASRNEREGLAWDLARHLTEDAKNAWVP